MGEDEGEVVDVVEGILVGGDDDLLVKRYWMVHEYPCLWSEYVGGEIHACRRKL
jgi:hypothetical protein